MEKDVPKTLILAVTIVLTLLPWILVKFNFFKRTTVYSGRIVDILDKVPVDLIEVGLRGHKTYTDKTGTFVLTLAGDQQGPLKISTTSEFEALDGGPNCQRKEGKFLQRSFACEALIYPKPYSVASRVLALEVADPYKAIDQIKLKKERLWGYLSVESRNLWGDKTLFVDLLTTYELIRTQLKTQPTKFAASRQSRILAEVSYFGQDLSGEGIAEVEAEVVDNLGRRTQLKLRFRKEEGIWRYLMPESPTLIRQFNLANKRVLGSL